MDVYAKDLHFRLARGVLSGISLFLLAGSVLAAQGKPATGAENYPARPIRLIIPTSVGGGGDTLARIVAPRLGDRLGTQIVVDNRSGAGGIIGADIVAKATPDGYTLLNVSGSYMINPSLYTKLPYDTMKDFERVCLLTCAPNVLVVHPTVAAKSVKELVALAKAKPGTLNYGSSGVGTTGYLGASMFLYMTGTKMVHVPYKGSGAATAGVVGGEVQVLYTAPAAVVPHARVGRLRMLGVTSIRRLPAIPNVPTIAESGLDNYDVNNCNGTLAPAKTPRAIINKLNTELVQVLRMPEVRALLEKTGYEVVASSPDEYTTYAKTDMDKWAKVLREMGFKPGNR